MILMVWLWSFVRGDSFLQNNFFNDKNMSDFVFVNNVGGGSGLLDFLNTVSQIAMAVCAIYVIWKGKEIYEKQKETDRKEYLREMKLNTLKDFSGYRNKVTGDEFSRVINEIPIVFADSESIIKKWSDFRIILEKNSGNFEPNAVYETNKALYDLFRKMCEDLDIDEKEKYNYKEFSKVFN